MMSCVVCISVSLFVGRARPDLSRCGTNTTNPCQQLSKYDTNNEFLSFPSTTATLVSSSSLFFTLFMQKFTKSSSTWFQCLSLLPYFAGLIIGSMSIRSYRNHTDDATAGFFLGSLCAYVIWNGSYKKIFRGGKQNYIEIIS